MSEQRVSIFISHKVASHAAAAKRIKEILEARTERLDVYTCEETPAGSEWRPWIEEQIAHAKVLLVLWPPPHLDLSWIEKEIHDFRRACARMPVVVVRPPGTELPDTVGRYQAIDACREQLRDRFLEPLYRNPRPLRIDVPLNSRVRDADIDRDAHEMEEALRGLCDVRAEHIGESLVADTGDLELPTGMERVRVTAPNGCRRILDWTWGAFSWADLRARAAEDKGKGTFWVSEMEQVMTDVAQGRPPRVMTSTFRGRGQDAGRIYHPSLERVDRVGDRPVRFRFMFTEVLVPELVRGRGAIGEVFNLLHIAGRVRWEVLDPFFVNPALAHKAAALDGADETARRHVIASVVNSLRVIQEEAERHGMMQDASTAFEPAQREVVERLLGERTRIIAAITEAEQHGDFPRLMRELEHDLRVNVEAMELLATRFLELVRADRAAVTRTLHYAHA